MGNVSRSSEEQILAVIGIALGAESPSQPFVRSPLCQSVTVATCTQPH